MIASEQPSADDRTVAAALARCLAPHDAPSEQSLPPSPGLTADDEAMLEELEMVGDTFIDRLVDELWGEDSFPAGLTEDEESEIDADSGAETGATVESDRPAWEIIHAWTSKLVETVDEVAWWDRSSELSGCEGAGESVCSFVRGLLQPNERLRGYCWYCLDQIACTERRETWVPDYQARWGKSRGSQCVLDWFRRSAVVEYPRPITWFFSASPLWSMVDELAQVYEVVNYDREDVLRVLIGDIIGSELYVSDEPGRFPDCHRRWLQDQPRMLHGCGAAVIDFFRAWSVLPNRSHGRHAPASGPTSWCFPAPDRTLDQGFRNKFPGPVLSDRHTTGGSRMPKLTFYPVGYADTFVIDLTGGEKIIFDYADRRNRSDKDDKRCDLPAELRKELGERTNYDVAVFTHLDQDHYDGATDFFYLEHDKAYQGKAADGEERIKMTEMWVPAAVLTEKLKEEESKVIQKEARYRLKNKFGILVFSRPDSLKDWLEKEGIKYDDVKHLLIDAGRTVPTFTQGKHGVEFWVHSPHARRQNDDEVVIRNDHALVLLAAFKVGKVETKVQLFADVNHEIIADIVNVTKKKENEARLEWDVFKISHHCSYLSLGPDKGKTKTKPVEEVEWLFEDQGHAGGIIISTSDPIPSNDDSDQPPHRQAANYYKDVRDQLDGSFLVTMEHPSTSDPKPLVIEISEAGPKLKDDKAKASAKSLTEAIAAARGSTEPPQTRVGFGQ